MTDSIQESDSQFFILYIIFEKYMCSMRCFECTGMIRRCLFETATYNAHVFYISKFHFKGEST